VIRLSGAGGAILLVLLAPSCPSAAPGGADEEVALRAVCGRCHDLNLVTEKARSKADWVRVFEKMSALGADGTDEQFDAIGRYIETQLTILAVNEASAREIAHVLNVPDEVAAAVVARRERAKFQDLADLASVRGVEAAAAAHKDRIVF
jgi:DNA uptake protein ComE-like DNA-binding protein